MTRMASDFPSTDIPHSIFAGAQLSPDHRLRAFHPVDKGHGAGFVADALMAPIERAIPGFEVRCDIAMKGRWQDASWTGSSGHVVGRFVAPLWDIPATRRIVFIRFGCFQRWEAGLVVETLLLLDLPSLMMQAGVWPLAPAMGPDLMAPPPVGLRGVWPQQDEASAGSLQLVEGMINGLKKFDGDGLSKMGMTDYWTDDFWWFGPAPIGSFRGHRDYERGHQLPFLTAFPDRVGGNHRARFGDGMFTASTGWPSITATHKGGGWLGLAPTDRAITMRVMDFWRRDGDRLAENWVMIDIPDLLNQLGIDLFGQMRLIAEARSS